MIDENKESNKKNNNSNNSPEMNYSIAYGITFGLMGGSFIAIMINIFFDFPLIWAFSPGIGMLIGIVIGAFWSSSS